MNDCPFKKHCKYPKSEKIKTILDAGCGTGGLIKALQAYGPQWKISGLDYSPVACAFAQAKTSAPIKQGSIEEIPFPDKQLMRLCLRM
jgi:ubiquinone/menaquinone biosynthesis C-methylase UbiE